MQLRLNQMNDICDLVEKTLIHDFDNIKVTVVDETHKHKKHSLYKPGKYHLKLEIVSEELSSMRSIDAHRLVNKSLASFLKNDLHALSIKIYKS